MWRRLKRLGAVQLLDGLVALPANPRNREHLEWLAEGIAEAGGEGHVWLAEAGSKAHARELVRRSNEPVAADYRLVIEAAATAAQGTRQRQALQRLRRALRAIEARDHFRVPEGERAARAVDELAAHVEVER